jgi:hypothetical protein
MANESKQYTEKEIEQGFQKIVMFGIAHPNLKSELGMWIADGDLLEMTNPEAAAICAREAPELRGGRSK